MLGPGSSASAARGACARYLERTSHCHLALLHRDDAVEGALQRGKGFTRQSSTASCCRQHTPALRRWHCPRPPPAALIAVARLCG